MFPVLHVFCSWWRKKKTGKSDAGFGRFFRRRVSVEFLKLFLEREDIEGLGQYLRI